MRKRKASSVKQKSSKKNLALKHKSSGKKIRRVNVKKSRKHPQKVSDALLRQIYLKHADLELDTPPTSRLTPGSIKPEIREEEML